MDEEWRDITGYEGLYKVSNFGNVYSNYTHKILSPGKTQDGYLYVILYKNKQKKNHPIHRLVGIEFIDNPKNLPLINHKDENPENNYVDNLEWCDHEYNNTYNGVNKRVAKKLSKKVYAYNVNGDIAYEFSSTQDAQRTTEFTSGGISNSCNKYDYTYCGYIWSYEKLSKQEVKNRFIANKESAYDSIKSIGDYVKEIKSKPVNQYDLDGNFIQSFPSTQEAGRKLGFSSSLIAGVCRGEHKYTHGYIFRYV